MMFIILNKEQADKVMGLNVANSRHILVPIERQGNQYILPSSIIQNYRYVAYHSILANSPQLDETDLNFPPKLLVNDD